MDKFKGASFTDQLVHVMVNSLVVMPYPTDAPSDCANSGDVEEMSEEERKLSRVIIDKSPKEREALFSPAGGERARESIQEPK